MGYFTEVGIGAPANLDDAKRWYWRAACKCPCFDRLLRFTDLSFRSTKLPESAGEA